MNTYYAGLANLRARLVVAGEEELANMLLVAERSASTSGEAISSTALILNQLLQNESTLPADIGNDARQLLDDGRSLWDRANRGKRR